MPLLCIPASRGDHRLTRVGAYLCSDLPLPGHRHCGGSRSPGPIIAPGRCADAASLKGRGFNGAVSGRHVRGGGPPAEGLGDERPRTGSVSCRTWAERVGFEPTVPCGTRALQARRIGHSRTSPRGRSAIEYSKPDLPPDRPKPHGWCQVWCGFGLSPGPFPGRGGILSALGFAGCKDGQAGGLRRNSERLGTITG